ncbi:MAG: 3'-5' exonuclease [Chlorobium sp.]
MGLFKKVLYIDTETTGTQAGLHGVIQVAALMEIDGEVVEQFEVKCQPHPDAVILDDALAVSGTTREELQHRTTSRDACYEFSRFVQRHIDKFDVTDKAYPAGYNVSFDLQFLDAWERVHGNKYGSGSYQNWKALDPLPFLRLWDFQGSLSLPNYRLATVCTHFGIALKAHDALSDIVATRELLRKLVLQPVVK